MKTENDTGFIESAVQSRGLRQLIIYTVISAVCLMIDTAILWTLVNYAGMAQGFVAVALGYSTGMFLHFALSIVFVFPQAEGTSMRRYTGYLSGYLLSGGVGILLSSLIIYYGALLGFHLLINKAVAIVISFTTVFLIRKYIVFGNWWRRLLR